MTWATYSPTATASTCVTLPHYICSTASTSTTTQIYISNGTTTLPVWHLPGPSVIAGNMKFALGTKTDIELPDGGRLVVSPDGSYRVDDAQAKTIYKASRFREFNTFLNASDRVEDFIRYCKGFDASQDEFLNLPIKTFLMWLIVEAAAADGSPEDQEAERLALEFKARARPRCPCGRFIARDTAAKGFLFCNGAHYDRYSAAQIQPAAKPVL